MVNGLIRGFDIYICLNCYRESRRNLHQTPADHGEHSNNHVTSQTANIKFHFGRTSVTGGQRDVRYSICGQMFFLAEHLGDIVQQNDRNLDIKSGNLWSMTNGMMMLQAGHQLFDSKLVGICERCFLDELRLRFTLRLILSIGGLRNKNGFSQNKWKTQAEQKMSGLKDCHWQTTHNCLCKTNEGTLSGKACSNKWNQQCLTTNLIPLPPQEASERASNPFLFGETSLNQLLRDHWLLHFLSTPPRTDCGCWKYLFFLINTTGYYIRTSAGFSCRSSLRRSWQNCH